MRYRVNFKFFLPAVGGRLIQEWQVEGIYEIEIVPKVDLEGDPVEPDEFENCWCVSIYEWTLGTNDGDILYIDLPKDVRMSIMDAIAKAGRALHKDTICRAKALADYPFKVRANS